MFRSILSHKNAAALELMCRITKQNSSLKQYAVTSLFSRRQSILFYSNSINNNESLKSQLEKLSKTDLIEMILQKDNPLNKSRLEEPKPMIHLEEDRSHAKASTEEKEFRGPPEINWAETCQRHIALKVSYLGWNYAGFASQGVNSMALPLNRLNFKKGLRMRHPHNRNQTMVATVEDYLFEALERCNLIENARTIVSTRSGRTDKGVSGLCQIITVKVRSVLPKLVLAANPDAVEGEKPFLEMINRFLPQDIRVIGWAPVPETFNARYDCSSRKYKYLFTLEGSGLDVDRMKEACKHLVGTHDFRNLSRMDGSKQRVVFTRHIFSACIQPADLGYPATGAQTGELGSPRNLRIVHPRLKLLMASDALHYGGSFPRRTRP
ncbi:pseudouridine synthase deg1 [Entomophthora muscae]|uniref:Pseudouridine synthase deg1 n=1 Tax=Entomophthora muscae TaxID=34485 RepID=A0ACC2TJ05_9FUNG|nr:pseudouridine synthase deg1 [Entomophthora muscae]